MDSLESQLRRCTRSWYAWAAAGVVSTTLFVAVGSTNIVPERMARPALPPLIYAAAPGGPSPVEHPSIPRPLPGTNLADAFKFDPTTTNQPPEVPIGKLDVSAFGGSLKVFDAGAGFGFDMNGGNSSDLAMAIGLRHTFEVQKPQIKPGGFIVFDRDKVDEIPVWLYGPQPRIPSKYERTNWHVLVFYAITEKGRTENISVLDSTDPMLEKSVVDAITAWNFRPARRGGQPVRIMAQQDVSYKPTQKSPFEL